MDDEANPSTLRTLHIDTGREWRGGQNQSWRLCRGLLDRGHSVLAVAQPDSPWQRRLRECHIDCREIRMRSEFDPFAVRKIRKVVQEFKPDLIHTHTAHAHSYAALVLGGGGNIPVIVSRRVDFPIGDNWLSRRKYRHPACRYLAISNGVRDVMISFGIPTERIHIAPSGVDPSRFAEMQDRKKIRSELGIAAGDYLILNVAALVDHKDQATLIRAMKDVSQQAPGAMALIAGEGELRGELEQLIDELNLKDRVRLLGYREDVPELLAAGDLFVMSSKQEGLCTSIIDAMLSHTPVVATAAGGIPDLVLHEKTGLLVPPRNPRAFADAILHLMQNKKLRREIRKAAYKHASENFTCDSMVESTLKAYREFIAGFSE